MKNLHEEPALVKQRRGRVSPHRRECPVFLLNLTLPDLLPVEIETGKAAAYGQNPRMVAIGDWGGRRHVLFAHHLVSHAHHLLPANGAVLPIDGEQQDLLLRARWAASYGIIQHTLDRLG